MRIVSLASGSSGNAILVDSGATKVLVDCGIGPRTLKQRLAFAGVAPEELSAVFVTHEHVDHSRGVAQVSAKWNWSVFGSAGTIRGLDSEVRHRAHVVPQHTRVGDLDIELIRVPHDANEPSALVFSDRGTGMRAGLAHDLGEPTDALIKAFSGVDLLCIEANHDAAMLRDGPYPAYLKNRVASATGHLSNEQAAAFIDAVVTSGLRAVLLLHLSEVNNTPSVACAATKRGITRRARKASLAAAVRKAPSAPIGMDRGVQLAFAI